MQTPSSCDELVSGGDSGTRRFAPRWASSHLVVEVVAEDVLGLGADAELVGGDVEGGVHGLGGLGAGEGLGRVDVRVAEKELAREVALLDPGECGRAKRACISCGDILLRFRPHPNLTCPCP